MVVPYFWWLVPCVMRVVLYVRVYGTSISSVPNLFIEQTYPNKKKTLTDLTLTLIGAGDM